MAKNKRNSKSVSIILVYFLLIFIVVLLMMIVAYLGGYYKANNVKDIQSDNTNEESINQTTKVVQEYNDKSSTVNNEIEDITKSQAGEKSSSKKGRMGTLYIVLDDVGNNLEPLKIFLELPMEITYAIMPLRLYTKQSAELIHSKGREIIIHQPMEPLGNSNPGKGSLFTWMNNDDILNQLKISYKSIPYAIGMNNHMGSKATTDVSLMTVVLDFLEERDMFFLDSKTITAVVGDEISKTTNVKYLQRNAMFLDNEKDQVSIEKAIRIGMQTATRNGHAVMIGHVMTTELADALLKMYPEILDQGYEFDKLSQYFTGDVD